MPASSNRHCASPWFICLAIVFVIDHCRPRGLSLAHAGLRVSILGFGASSVGGCFRDTKQQESVDVVHYALKHGVNVIDTAPW
jgi:hypothetical protein